MKSKLLLLTTPFTQMNTPYPATAYLKGFLNTIGYESYQADLGIELILQLFSKQGLEVVFDLIATSDEKSNKTNSQLLLKNKYLQTIDPVIKFLQNKNSTLAHRIIQRTYLPESNRFQNIKDLDLAFGTMGIHDKAKYFATLYLEDIGDMIQECLDPHFGFSRYAEKLGMSASSFTPIYEELKEEHSLIDDILCQLIAEKIVDVAPDVICISIPFPGNLYSSLRCGQYIKNHHPHIKVVFGGGFANTEWRELSDSRIFEFCDFITLDDGEAPLKFLLEHLDGNRTIRDLKRVFTLQNDVIVYCNTTNELDVSQKDVGTPDYEDLYLDEYLSVLEILNPMHRLWNDGRWNKLTLAHGCYWGKCTFCDVSLDYIGRYEPISAEQLCDRIEAIIHQTGDNGFHFVDEAASPAILKKLSIEIIKRGITVVWWTNIRFEKRFTPELCLLMQKAGCIAISAGLEVASDRLLKLIDKGVTVEQAAQVAHSFTKVGIMVHAYLMYGFPTQTNQETVDALEMVRQMFDLGIIHSAYWHRFALTTHSPVGTNPKAYNIRITGPSFEGFAKNDLTFEDPTGGTHEKFSDGLNKALYNFMHQNMLDSPLAIWFNFKIPGTIISQNYIRECISNKEVN